MLKLLPPSLLACGLAVALANTSSAAVIGFWDFNNGFALANNVPQIVHNATTGAGILYQQRADTDGNGKGGNAFVDAGNSLNSIAGQAMAWDDVAKTGENDAEFFITFSTFNFTNIVVSFDIKGNATAGSGINSYDLKYALTGLVDVTNPGAVIGTIKDFDGGLSTVVYDDQLNANSTTFSRITIDFSALGITAMDNQNVVALRFDDWEANDALSIDNFLITGTPVGVPEPAAAVLGGLGLLGFLRRRR